MISSHNAKFLLQFHLVSCIGFELHPTSLLGYLNDKAVADLETPPPLDSCGFLCYTKSLNFILQLFSVDKVRRCNPFGYLVLHHPGNLEEPVSTNQL